MPDNETRVTGGDKQREVHLKAAAACLHCDLTCQKSTDDETQAPSDEAGKSGDDEDEDIGECRAAWNAGQSGQQFPYRACVRKHVSQQKNETHLRHER